MNDNIKGPFLKNSKIASDGTKVAPVYYTENGHYYRYGIYLYDSLRNGQIPIVHNPDGIAYIRYGGSIRRILNSELSVAKYKHTITSIEYKVNDKLHRLNGPALIEDWRKSWYENGLQHRFDGPQEIVMTDLNPLKIVTEKWRVQDQYHRFNGPAINDAKRKKTWFFLGKKIPDNIIRFDKGVPMTSFDKAKILETSLNFDRMYGKILEVVYNTNNVPSEKEIYNIIKGENEKGI